MINIDYLTLSTVIGALSIIYLIIIAVLKVTNTNEEGIEMWLYSALISTFGFLSLVFKPIIHDYSTFINNTCALTSILLILEGVLKFRHIGNKDRRKLYLVIAIIVFALMSLVNRNHATSRYMSYDLLMVIMYCVIGYYFLKGVKGTERRLSYLFVASFTIMGIGFMYRWILAVTGVFAHVTVPGHASTSLLFLLTIIWLPLHLFSLLLVINYRAQHKLIELSATDPLTGLNNRRNLEDRIQDIITTAKANNNKYVLYLIDINGFKTVNDTYGHIFGDHILKGLAKNIQTYTRQEDYCARYGGDEFVIALRSNNDKTIQESLKRLHQKLESPFVIANKKVKLRISIGYGIIDKETTSSDQVISIADQSMYEQKNDRSLTTLIEEIQ